MLGGTGREIWSTWLQEEEWQEAQICVPYDFYSSTIQKHMEIMLGKRQKLTPDYHKATRILCIDSL